MQDMKQVIEIDIGRDFARLPFGRRRSDGENSAERFREDFLIPNLERAQKLVVKLDNARGVGSSFLDEAFGVLVAKLGWTTAEFFSRIELTSERDPTLLDDVRRYVSEHAVN